MSTTMVIVMLALLVTGVTTTAVFALPPTSTVTGEPTPNGEGVTIQRQQHLQAHLEFNDTTQTQAQFRLRNQAQICTCLSEGNDCLIDGDSELVMGYSYHHRVGEQSCSCSQDRNGLNGNANPTP